MTTTPLIAAERLFRALADGTRLRILGLLTAGEVCVCDIHETLGIPQSKASRHLAALRRAGLVAARRDGLWMHYRLAAQDDPVLAAVLDSARHALTHVPAVRKDLDRLQRRTGCCAPPAAASNRAACCTAEEDGSTRASG